ncbi:DRTGG domain-containing protein [Sporomusa acidovorans]|uniref:DRTGG domain-containing protein n=1 Tax=Sporomusa acidovorans (strain ATCC 49682 / DSM 3132 / Mol) TaxID=1123286 RepID=A0ABZ3J1D5_SPOA4|nr:DRTGG domain-containing protein [Sporomusa acidovorans]OZC22472.1 DRTGG domain protein [Sporomusa acidovorans DSM 3132]SDE74072.1 DRTGG domain-containing protein [Sporomusa acidovorans]
MNVQELTKALPLRVVAGQSNLTKEISGGYVSDLLSNVMGQARSGNIWVTMQGHQNIVAVASLAGLAAIIVTGGVEPDKDAIRKAGSEDIVLLTTTLPSFEVVGRLYGLGITGE